MVNRESVLIDLTLSDTEEVAPRRRKPGTSFQNGELPGSPIQDHIKSRPAYECDACREAQTGRCDGEYPCSSCAEPGIPCIYPGNDGPTVLNVSSSYKIYPPTLAPFGRPGPVTSSSGRQGSSEQELTTAPLKLKSVHNQSTLVARAVSQAQQGPYNHHSIEEASFDEDSDSDEGPPLALDNIDQVTRLLKKHEARLKAHQEYLVRPLLSRAKLGGAPPWPIKTASDHPNPFSTLIASSKARPKPELKSSSLSLLVKSHKTGAPKKWTTVTVPLNVVKTSPTILPKYKSIGRLGSSLLAPNSGVLKYLPYFADVEKFPDADKKRVQEIEDYYHTDEHRMRNQRRCFELAELWKPLAERFLSDMEIQFKDIMWYMFDEMDPDWECRRCKTILETMIDVNALTWNFSSLRVRNERKLSRARLVTSAFENVAGFSIWHIIVETDFIKQALQRTEGHKREPSTLCSICFLHNCIVHGAYIEPENTSSGANRFSEGNNQGQSSVKINDDECHLNERQMAVVPNQNMEGTHQCGLYCVEGETAVKAILGRKQGGGAGGVYNPTINATRPALDNHKICSPECFWQPERRTRILKVSHTKSFEPDISAEQKRLFKSLLKLHCNNQRVACMIAADFEGLTCMDTFYYILANTQNPSHVDQPGLSIGQLGTRKLSKVAQGLDTSKSKDLDDRPPFIPCSHEGLCQNNPDCSCSEDHVHCEHFCGCDISCKRRYQGCSCSGSSKVCFDDNRCECWALNRECDPWLCGTCGAMEVLDPVHKYNEEIRKGRCRNTKTQLELPARTIKAPSEIQGWGLFAGQDLEKNAFIGEYKGERVGNQESDRRGTVYHHLGQEYLFTVNREQQIDGSNFGNKMRFINNSQRDEHINVLAKNLLCNGVQRIMLYAKRAVKAGDELLYNYNYPETVYSTFWERGEGPKSGGIVAKPTIPVANGRMAKKIGQPSDDGSSSSRPNVKQSAGRVETMSTISGRAPNGRVIPKMQHPGRLDEKREAKRKRVSDGEVSPAYATEMREIDRVQDEEDVSEFEGDLANTSTDEDEASEEEEVDNSSHEDEPLAAVVNRQRRIGPHDKRKGGHAQKEAWVTRKKKLTR